MMTERRFARLISAHGADPARWPEGERAAGIAWADSHPEARKALAAERRLDAMLDLAAAPPMTDSAGTALADRIMATLDSRALPDDLPMAGAMPVPAARPPLRLFATLGAAAAVALVGLGLLLGRSVTLSQPATAEADQMLLLGGPALTAGFSS